MKRITRIRGGLPLVLLAAIPQSLALSWISPTVAERAPAGGETPHRLGPAEGGASPAPTWSSPLLRPHASRLGLDSSRPHSALNMLAAQGVDVDDTRLLSRPAISKTHIAFVYAGDLWVAGVDGKNARRLTTDKGIDSSPAFSPDGMLLAFSAEYDGNIDVYVVPVAGGVPARLTWHPAPDIVQGFTPDGSAVLFTSPRAVFTNRYSQLFTVPVKGGVEEPLKLPNASKAAYSPDGSTLAYTPLGERFNEWKRYRGGTVTNIRLCRLSDYSVEKIPQPSTRCNDTDPMWIGGTVYFRSDRNGEFNLFSFDPKSKAIKQLTAHADFPVVAASAGGGRIVYEQAGYLHVFDQAAGKSTRLVVGAPADLVETRPRYVSGSRWIRAASLSPTGARAAFEFRGEIVTLPAEKGDPR